MHVGTMAEQEFDDVGMLTGGRPHQRRLSTVTLLDVDVSAPGKQRAQHVDAATARRLHEWGDAGF